jgi:hypothetical protein
MLVLIFTDVLFICYFIVLYKIQVNCSQTQLTDFIKVYSYIVFSKTFSALIMSCLQVDYSFLVR